MMIAVDWFGPYDFYCAWEAAMFDNAHALYMCLGKRALIRFREQDALRGSNSLAVISKIC